MTGARRRVLITGASGFLGACLTRAALADDEDVHLMLRRTTPPWRLADCVGRCTVHIADLRDASSIRRVVAACRPDVVYHLAACGVSPTQKDRGLILTTVVLGLANLLDAVPTSCTLVNAGTCWEYGPRDAPISPEQSLDPRTDYAVAKASAALLCASEAHCGRAVTTVRIFSAYGPGEEPTRLVPYVMGCCLRGEAPRVSAGHQVRDFIHADDVVTLLQVASETPAARGRVLHAGTGTPHTVREMVETILTICGGASAEYGATPLRSGEPRSCVADITTTTALTGWVPRYDLAAGVQRTWDSFHSRGHSRAA